RRDGARGGLLLRRVAREPGRHRNRLRRWLVAYGRAQRFSLALAIAQHVAHAVVGRLADALAFERVAHELVPAAVGDLPVALGAADDQPLGGARHRDVEQAAVFVARGILEARARRGDGVGVVLL